MRPEILYPLFAPVTSLAGVGPRIATLVERVAGPHLVDLLWHLPTGLIDRRYAPEVGEAQPGRIATLTVQVDRHQLSPNRRLPYKVFCSDETGTIALVFFHARPDYLKRALPEGETRLVSGKVERFGQELQITHPDHMGGLEDKELLQVVEPVHGLTQGLSLKVMGKAVRGALAQVPELDEWIDLSFLAKQKWAPWRESLIAAHAPEEETSLEPHDPNRMRLAYDELLANQLALMLVRQRSHRMAGRRVKGDGSLAKLVMGALPFELTVSQSRALEEIQGDMAEDTRMHRLLQGDVGSGKTVVALLAMLGAMESGAQGALLAPTEILARQHLATILPLAEAAGIKAALLTGREKGRKRQAILDDLASGETQIAIGTHTLFQDDVAFKDLALAVIDEQHRFGVHQRLALAAKGRGVDILVMTATPIPRTLTLTFYGDMEVSNLTEKPAGRPPVDTRTISLTRLEEVTEGIGRAIANDGKVFWVCPLIEENEVLDLAAVEERYDHLKSQFGARVGLLHGRMKPAEKDKVMEEFAEGLLSLLVATTVIEVGIDVPDATVMVIEHAERFGLAQLHQLRGRIGRGSEKSSCLLLCAANLGKTARARLEIMRESDDGFRIAEEDLRLRGAGELLGTRQSGLPQFRLADLAHHQELFGVARDDAKLILASDPELQSERGRSLRELLYLFERDAAVRLLRSG